jgi:hypothetical protein
MNFENRSHRLVYRFGTIFRQGPCFCEERTRRAKHAAQGFETGSSSAATEVQIRQGPLVLLGAFREQQTALPAV